MSDDMPPEVLRMVAAITESINNVFNQLHTPVSIRLDVSMSLAMSYLAMLWKDDPALTKVNIQQAIHMLELMRDAKDADDLQRIRLMLNVDAPKGKIL